jgi:hypothetical protein
MRLDPTAVRRTRVAALLSVPAHAVARTPPVAAPGREDLRLQEARYANNASTILDQITSQVAVAEAEQSLIAARYDYQVTRAQLEALVGRDL